MKITGVVQEVQASHVMQDWRDTPPVTLDPKRDKLRVTVSYESANVLGSLSFDVSMAEARNWHVGQGVAITVEPSA